jgi:hypothetical protein
LASQRNAAAAAAGNVAMKMIKKNKPPHLRRRQFFEFLLQLNSSLKARGSNSNRTFANDLEPANFVNREPSDVIEISVSNPVRMRTRAQKRVRGALFYVAAAPVRI